MGSPGAVKNCGKIVVESRVEMVVYTPVISGVS